TIRAIIKAFPHATRQARDRRYAFLLHGHDGTRIASCSGKKEDYHVFDSGDALEKNFGFPFDIAVVAARSCECAGPPRPCWTTGRRRTARPACPASRRTARTTTAKCWSARSWPRRRWPECPATTSGARWACHSTDPATRTTAALSTGRAATELQ